MSFRINTKPVCVRLIFLLTLILATRESRSQQAIENSIFWEIQRSDLGHPSYLFGTFHLMGSGYVDSLTNLIEKFKTSKNVVGELLLDSSMTTRMMASAQLHDTTLDKLLDSTLYHQTARWLHELSGYDLRMFNSMNPMTIQIFIMTMLQQKYFPLKQANEMPMDMYFQDRAKKEGKQLIGLEDFETQVHALFDQFTLQRQAEMLGDFVQDRSKTKTELLEMNKYYRAGELTKLEELLATQNYSEEEAEILLDNRNKQWMEQLPDLIKENQTFIAVGALHLPGKNGLIALLRKAGYTVSPVATR